jgi:hypothetical protein
MAVRFGTDLQQLLSTQHVLGNSLHHIQSCARVPPDIWLFAALFGTTLSPNRR